MAEYPHPTLPKRPRRPEPPTGTPEHEEWLLDESVDDTFPASDPPAQMQPGSTLAVNKMKDEGRETPPTEQQLKDGQRSAHADAPKTKEPGNPGQK
jgi:hypothetical protein